MQEFYLNADSYDAQRLVYHIKLPTSLQEALLDTPDGIPKLRLGTGDESTLTIQDGDTYKIHVKTEEKPHHLFLNDDSGFSRAGIVTSKLSVQPRLTESVCKRIGEKTRQAARDLASKHRTATIDITSVRKRRESRRVSVGSRPSQSRGGRPDQIPHFSGAIGTGTVKPKRIERPTTAKQSRSSRMSVTSLITPAKKSAMKPMGSKKNIIKSFVSNAKKAQKPSRPQSKAPTRRPKPKTESKNSSTTGIKNERKRKAPPTTSGHAIKKQKVEPSRVSSKRGNTEEVTQEYGEVTLKLSLPPFFPVKFEESNKPELAKPIEDMDGLYESKRVYERKYDLARKIRKNLMDNGYHFSSALDNYYKKEPDPKVRAALGNFIRDMYNKRISVIKRLDKKYAILLSELNSIQGCINKFVQKSFAEHPQM
mmetsp:Transcript_24507/g.27259  ORF Transcript_24507/g.27259 Transcript_24507/m.27259 type:complete len:423 (-) Transcript_24507:36-1304(-)